MVTAPKKHYVVGWIVNPSRIHGRINNPSYIANNPGSSVPTDRDVIGPFHWNQQKPDEIHCDTGKLGLDPVVWYGL